MRIRMFGAEDGARSPRARPGPRVPVTTTRPPSAPRPEVGSAAARAVLDRINSMRDRDDIVVPIKVQVGTPLQPVVALPPANRPVVIAPVQTVDILPGPPTTADVVVPPPGPAESITYTVDGPLHRPIPAPPPAQVHATSSVSYSTGSGGGMAVPEGAFEAEVMTADQLAAARGKSGLLPFVGVLGGGAAGFAAAGPVGAAVGAVLGFVAGKFGSK